MEHRSAAVHADEDVQDLVEILPLAALPAKWASSHFPTEVERNAYLASHDLLPFLTSPASSSFESAGGICW